MFRAAPLLAALALAAGAAAADWQPTRAVRIVLPFAPGGQSDVVMRTLAEPLGRALGQPVVIENRPGGGGTIATGAVARSAPDGHTLLVGTNGPFAIAPLLQPEAGPDPLQVLSPVALLGTSPNLVAVSSSLGVATLAELVARARARPGELNYASVGSGSVSHLTMELLNGAAGIRIAHIPYTGSAPAVAALLGGQVQVLSANPTALMAHVESGRIRVVAQTTATRSPLIAAVPTAAEAGYAGLESALWNAIFVPAGTPPEAIARLHAEFRRLARDPDLKRSLWDRQWIDPSGEGPEAVVALIHAERARWREAIRSAGIAAP